MEEAARNLRAIKYLLFGLLVAVLIAGGLLIGSNEIDKSNARAARADQLIDCGQQGISPEDC